jgi:hypothetical protein
MDEALRWSLTVGRPIDHRDAECLLDELETGASA